MRQLPSPSMSSGLRLTASARITLCWDNPKDWIRAYWCGAHHCRSNRARAGVLTVWNRMKQKRPSNSTQNPGANAWTNRNGAPRTRDTSDSGTGRNRENQAPKGSDSPAAVIHHTACNNPACRGVIPRSSRMKGRNRPKV